MAVYAGPNRVATAIADMRRRVAELSPEKRAKLDRDMALTASEHFQYQQVQARAHAQGLISAAEAQSVYRALGEVGSARNGGWASGTDLATKVVVTKLVGELLGARLRGRGRGGRYALRIRNPQTGQVRTIYSHAEEQAMWAREHVGRGGRRHATISLKGARILAMLAPYPWEESSRVWSWKPQGSRAAVEWDPAYDSTILAQSGPGVGFPRGDHAAIRRAIERGASGRARMRGRGGITLVRPRGRKRLGPVLRLGPRRKR